ncbi:MAG: hypothetical protein WD627_05120, partial [Actinomycetota bacterium]
PEAPPIEPAATEAAAPEAPPIEPAATEAAAPEAAPAPSEEAPAPHSAEAPSAEEVSTEEPAMVPFGTDENSAGVPPDSAGPDGTEPSGEEV